MIITSLVVVARSSWLRVAQQSHVFGYQLNPDEASNWIDEWNRISFSSTFLYCALLEHA